MQTEVNAKSVGNSLRLYCPAPEYSGQMERFDKAMRAAMSAEVEITLVPNPGDWSRQEGYSDLPVASDHMHVGMRFNFADDSHHKEITIVGRELDDRDEIKRFFLGMEGAVKIRAVAKMGLFTCLIEKS